MIRIFKRTLFVIAVFWSTSGAFGQTLTAEDQRDLDAVVEQFLADTTALNISGVVNAMPPSVIDDLARRNNMTDAQLKKAAVQALETAMGSVALLKIQMETTAPVLGQTSTGRVYALLPTSLRMRVEGAVYRAVSHTLAIKEAGQWYLIRVDEPSQRQMLANAMPDFSDITFPEASVELIE